MTKTALKGIDEKGSIIHRDNLHHMLPIFGSHVKRIGYIRVIFGGFSMYISLPFFMIYHLLFCWLISNELLSIFTGLEKLNFKHYIIIDRYKIRNLPWFDRLNCMYCDYANGLASFYEAKLFQIKEEQKRNDSSYKMLCRFILLLIGLPVHIIFSIHGYIVYDLIVSRILGMNRLTHKAAFKSAYLDENEKVDNYIYQSLFIYYRIECERLTNNLEQIESSWCPVKHFNTDSKTVYPEHQNAFFEQDEIKKMKHVLQTTGTVSRNLTGS